MMTRAYIIFITFLFIIFSARVFVKLKRLKAAELEFEVTKEETFLPGKEIREMD